MSSWKVTALAHREVIEGALVAHEDAWDWDPDIVISGSEVAEDRPDDWRLEAWLPRKPTTADKSAITELFPVRPLKLDVEKLPDMDWLIESQKGLRPIRAGQFYIHSREHAPSGEAGLCDLMIPASEAFGTGQHATTAGCLEMLSEMKRKGVVVRNCADIGTGTGVLAFGALRLWPAAMATASDIDTICIGTVTGNSALNGFALGAKSGELTMLASHGMDHPLLQARGPYDLITANILAGPLIELAQDFADCLQSGGQLVLAGLLETQEPQVRAACRRAGLRLAARRVKGDWSILWLRKRRDNASSRAYRRLR
jgi:ribosomal protein L11 methyltransferase